ncbi:traB domain-containing protein [Quillaja saponaria]|uniref:TraB domain-containing protein n=1 Tax=Quillaja saponaria TaxID=32244 RepID=A0AAD7PWZ0_QUISA|nr:traB domain-containing protein [Quillaja saponaria]
MCYQLQGRQLLPKFLPVHYLWSSQCNFAKPHVVLSLSSMASTKTFPIIMTNPVFLTTKPLNSFKVSIKPPPTDFGFRSEISHDSRATIAQIHPELLDLADNGTLVLIEKKQFGSVPAWRTEFVEPEAIWLVGTSHIFKELAMDVERVVRAEKPDNVVVELCRSRQVLFWFSVLVEFYLLIHQYIDQKRNLPELNIANFCK